MRVIISHEQNRSRLLKKFGYDISKARRFVLTKAKIKEGPILEVGTGRGHMAIALAKKKLSLTSIDSDRKIQVSARENIEKEGLEKFVALKTMNAENLKFKNAQFDCVISVNFIHHAMRPLKCIKEMARASRNMVIIADLNKKGQHIMEKVHSLDNRKHPLAKVSFREIRGALKRLGLSVDTYKDKCQVVLIARKGV